MITVELIGRNMPDALLEPRSIEAAEWTWRRRRRRWRRRHPLPAAIVVGYRLSDGRRSFEFMFAGGGAHALTEGDGIDLDSAELARDADELFRRRRPYLTNDILRKAQRER